MSINLCNSLISLLERGGGGLVQNKGLRYERENFIPRQRRKRVLWCIAQRSQKPTVDSLTEKIKTQRQSSSWSASIRSGRRPKFRALPRRWVLIPDAALYHPTDRIKVASPQNNLYRKFVPTLGNCHIQLQRHIKIRIKNGAPEVLRHSVFGKGENQ